jgi:glutathione S-transferase
MAMVSLIMLLAALQSFVFGGFVAWARSKYKVVAPAITGNEIFERHFRVHYNTNEQLLIFLPAVWFFGAYVSPLWASILGSLYVLGRIIYAVGYVRSPLQREVGFVMSSVPNAVLLLGAIYGAIRAITTS